MSLAVLFCAELQKNQNSNCICFNSRKDDTKKKFYRINWNQESELVNIQTSKPFVFYRTKSTCDLVRTIVANRLTAIMTTIFLKNWTLLKSKNFSQNTSSEMFLFKLGLHLGLGIEFYLKII